MKPAALASAVLLLLGLGAIGNLHLHRQSNQWREKLRTLQFQRGAEAQRTRGTASSPSSSAAAAVQSVRPLAAEIAATRAQITQLETQAEAQYAVNSELVQRDPEKGMTRLEYLRNVGRATPAAAFQSLAWAVLKGDEKVATQSIGIDDAVRSEVEQFFAGLPEQDRAKYGSAEGLFALFIAKALVNVSAIEIVETRLHDAQNATLTVRGLMGNDQRLPLRLGATGWQLWEGPAQAEWLRAEFTGKR